MTKFHDLKPKFRGTIRFIYIKPKEVAENRLLNNNNSKKWTIS